MIAYQNGQPSADLIRLQAAHKTMLRIFAAYCEKHSIDWFLVAGSALGAVREQDAIPWDDDLDVGLIRADYERLRKLVRADPMPGLFFQDWESEPGYWLFFSRLRMEGTVIGSAEFAGQDFHSGIFVDVFPYDPIPESGMARRLQRMAIGVLNLFIMPMVYEAHARNAGPFRRLAKAIAVGAARLLPRRVLIRMREAVAQMAGPHGTITDCFGMFGTSSFRRTQVAKTSLLPPARGQFGDMEVNLPADADGYLARLYGDYMARPPEGQRLPTHTSMVKFPD